MMRMMRSISTSTVASEMLSSNVTASTARAYRRHRRTGAFAPSRYPSIPIFMEGSVVAVGGDELRLLLDVLEHGGATGSSSVATAPSR